VDKTDEPDKAQLLAKSFTELAYYEASGPGPVSSKATVDMQTKGRLRYVQYFA